MANRKVRRVESLETWAARMERFRRHQGSRSDFCRKEGITLPGLNYWLKKTPVPGKKLEPLQHRSAFSAVEVINDRTAAMLSSGCDGRGLPDPRWTAEFLRHFLGLSS